jgi:hypothetical protein
VSSKSKEARERAATTRQDEHERQGRVFAEQRAEFEAMQENTARLRALRLAKEERQRRANARKAAREGLAKKPEPTAGE